MFVSILGSNQRLHDSLTGVEGSFDHSIGAVSHLSTEGVRTVMVNVPMKPNLSDLGVYMELAHKLGIRNVSLIGLYQLGRAKRNWDMLAASIGELKQALSDIRSTSEVFVDHRYYPHVHNCCSQAYTVTSEGAVIGCPYLREVAYYGNIRDADVLAMWNSDEWRQVRFGRVQGECQKCELFEGSCGGGCRASALQYTGDLFASDPLCWKPDRKEAEFSNDLRILK